MAGFSRRQARGRGARQTPLLVYGMVAVVIAFLGKSEPPLFEHARAALSDVTAPLLDRIREPLLAVERWVDNVRTVFAVYRENLELRRENAELRRWQHVALLLENRLQRYEMLLNAVPDRRLPTITARVIGESNRPFVRTMILNAGSDQQVEKGQAVVDDRGLLGRIYVTGERTSWVLLLSDLSSRVPVVIEPSQRRAILSGDNTPSPQLELDVGDRPIRPGDRVLSTGDGGLVPPDLPIGVVVRDGKDFRVALFAKPGTSDFVHVIDYRLPEPPAASEPVSRVPLPTRPPQTAARAGTPKAALTRTAVQSEGR